MCVHARSSVLLVPPTLLPGPPLGPDCSYDGPRMRFLPRSIRGREQRVRLSCERRSQIGIVIFAQGLCSGTRMLETSSEVTGMRVSVELPEGLDLELSRWELAGVSLVCTYDSLHATEWLVRFFGASCSLTEWGFTRVCHDRRSLR